MKSPCHDCININADKNNSICTDCDARVKYVQGIEERFGVILSADNSLEPDIKSKKEVKSMSERGDCGNCERKNMTLPARGLCGLCNRAWVKAPMDGKEAALAAAKAKVLAGAGVLHGHPITGPRKIKKQRSGVGDQGAEKEKPEPVTYKVPDPIDAWGAICLEFKGEKDQNLLAQIMTLANDQRRNTEQQIFWILEQYFSVGQPIVGTFCSSSGIPSL